jgi:uncharacterized protein YrrD
MKIDLGTDIVSSDGEKIGEVDGLVVDPRTGELRSVILRKGFFFPTDQIIPIESVRDATDERVVVNFTKEDADAMTEYLSDQFLTPPAGYYGAMSGVYWPVAPVYTTSATGAGDETNNLLVDDQVEEEMPGAVILTEGTLVVDQDGEDVGRITEIASDERGRVSGFRVEEGFFRHHERYVPAHFIAAADDRVVTLSTTKASLEELHEG